MNIECTQVFNQVIIRPTGGYFPIHTINLASETITTINDITNERFTQDSDAYRKISSFGISILVGKNSKPDF